MPELAHPDCAREASERAVCPHCGRPSDAPSPHAVRRRMLKRLGLFAAVVTCVVVFQQVRHAYAVGTPTLTTLAYSGSLLTFGAPDNSAHTMVLGLFVNGANDGGIGSAACTSTASVTCVNGQFTIPLSSSCVSVIQQNPNVEAEVIVDSVPMGLVNVTAVPYAVEAGSVGATGITGTLPIANGGTGSSTQNFVAQDSPTGEGLLPAGTTGQRVGSTNGMIRYNTTNNSLEAFVDGAWVALSWGAPALLWQEMSPAITQFQFSGPTQTTVSVAGVPSGARYILADVFADASKSDQQTFCLGRGCVQAWTAWASPNTEPTAAFTNLSGVQNTYFDYTGESDGYTPYYGMWYSTMTIPINTNGTVTFANPGNSGSVGWIYMLAKMYSY